MGQEKFTNLITKLQNEKFLDIRSVNSQKSCQKDKKPQAPKKPTMAQQIAERRKEMQFHRNNSDTNKDDDKEDVILHTCSIYTIGQHNLFFKSEFRKKMIF